MHSAKQPAGGVTAPVLLITLAFCFLGSFATGWLSTWEPFLVLGLMLLLGLPHGATDHGLFLALSGGRPPVKKVNFYVAYLLLIGSYGLVWWFFPIVAFSIFILLSIYHFGQSNWVGLNYGSGVGSRLHYLIWGAGILLTPILLHAGESIEIVNAMTGTSITDPGLGFAHSFMIVAAVLNVALAGWLTFTGRLTVRRLLRELLAYGVLTAMFLTNSLLLGFTVYFVFWHSLNSAMDQARFFERRLDPELRTQLYREIGSTVLGAFVFCLILWLGPGPSAALTPGIIGGIFIFISLLTLPHMLLVEQLYNSWSPNAVGLNESIKQSIHITKPQHQAT